MKRENKKTKTIIALLTGILLILSLIFLYYYDFHQEDYLFNKLQNILFDKNAISVEGKNFDINKIIIELVDYSQGVVFKEGKKIKRIRNEYGENYFKVFYDSLLISEAWIFKTNWYHTHKYFFEITKKDSTFEFMFRVKGPDKESLGYKMCYSDKHNKTLTEVFLNGNSLNSGSVIEEHFHAFQNDNLSKYSNGEFNFEFEAKVATAAVAADGPGYQPINDIMGFQDEVYFRVYGSNNMVITPTQVVSTDFVNKYIDAANQYAAYNKANNVGNKHYKAATTVQPYSLQKMVRGAYEK